MFGDVAVPLGSLVDGPCDVVGGIVVLQTPDVFGELSFSLITPVFKRHLVIVEPFFEWRFTHSKIDFFISITSDGCGVDNVS